MKDDKKILVAGALEQIGSELVAALKARYGAERVVASDIRIPHAGAFEQVDCTQPLAIQDVLRRHEIGAIYHMTALLSAVAEEQPQIAWSINLGGLYNVLEVARQNGTAVFCPSSIGAFGPSTPRDATPQVTIQRPTTMYGVTKVAGEMLCDYYFERFGLDARGLRLPGPIFHEAPPGGGTTDYAGDIFYQAVRYRHYTCFHGPDTRLDLMYMPDAIDGIIQLMEADPAHLKNRNAFNVTAINFTPEELAAEIRQSVPDFAIDYEVDPVRQAISISWPRSVDHSAARAEWDWSPRYDLAAMTKDMLAKLGDKLTTPARPA